MKKGVKKSLLILLAITFAIAAAGCGGDSAPSGGGDDEQGFEPVTLRYATQHPIENPAQTAAEAIKAEVEAKTEGRVLIDIYPANQLGDYMQVYDDVIMGTIDMAHTSTPESYDPRCSAGFLPYLATDFDDLSKVFAPDAYLPTLMADIQGDLGVKFFGYFCEGFNGIGMVKQVIGPADIGVDKGVLCRVPGIDAFKFPTEYLGYRTSTIPYADVFTAMQTGVIDGWMGGPAILNYQNYRELIHYYYDYNLDCEATQIYMNMDKFNSLLPEDQRVLEAAVLKQCAGSIGDAKIDNEKYLQLLRDYGIEVITFSQDELDAFAKGVRENVWPMLAESYGKEFLDELAASVN